MDLDCPKQILPDVLNIGGVSEGQNGVVLVDRDYGSDGLHVLLDDVALEGSVGLVAANALPGHGVLLAAHLERVKKGDLLFVGEG